ncbi:MAG: hypothetical protein ACXVHU_05030 [Methanobacterium sp.]
MAGERKEPSKKIESDDEKTSEIWVTEKEERMESASGDIREYERDVTVNPPSAGGKILKDAVGARGHNPGYDTGRNFSMDTVRKAADVVNRGQERPEVKWPKD